MIPAHSHALDVDDEEQIPQGGRPPTLVNLHFIRSALRRRWLVCVLSAVLGLLAATAFLVVFPVAHNAKASLQLAHRQDAEPLAAMATDVSLLRTRTVASTTIANLGLAMTPDEFLKNVKAEPVSPEILVVTLTGPNDAEATRRLAALTSVYLTFRAEHLTAQSNAYIIGMQQRIEKLQGEVADLSHRVDQLSAGDSSNASKLGDTISQRSFVQGRIDNFRQSIEDATLQNTAVVSSSVVVDPAAAEPGGAKRRMALVLASGLIGGAALGCGTVLFFAITSDRLRRRSDVAAALEVPVTLSVGRITPLPRKWLWFPHLRTLASRRAGHRQRLAQAIEMELPVPSRSGRLAVVCLDNSDEAQFAVATAAMDLASYGCSVALIDLTNNHILDAELVSPIPGSSPGPILLRPPGIPALASSAADLRAVRQWDSRSAWSGPSDINLVLADLDPSVGADYLKAWTDRVIIVVTAGRSSAERVRTAAELVRTAGLELRLAALLRMECTDNSSGTAGFDRPSSLHIVDRHDQSAYAAEWFDEEQKTVEGQVAADTEPAATLRVEPGDGEVTAKELTSDDELSLDDEPTVEMRASPAETVDDGQVPSEGLAADNGLTREDGSTEDLQEAFGEAQTPNGQLIRVEDQANGNLVADDSVRNDEQTTDFEIQATTEQETAAQEQMAARDQPAPEPTIAEEEATLETELVAELDRALNPLENTNTVEGRELDLANNPLVHVGSAPGSDDGESDRCGADFEASVDGWHLYIEAYPPTYLQSAPGSEDDEVDSELDDVVSSSDSAADGPDDETEVPGSQTSLATSENDAEHTPTAQAGADGNGRDGAQRPASNGEVSHGPSRQSTRARAPQRRSRRR
jgi:hypothetical protein